jgi:hypothetical protein
MDRNHQHNSPSPSGVVSSNWLLGTLDIAVWSMHMMIYSCCLPSLDQHTTLSLLENTECHFLPKLKLNVILFVFVPSSNRLFNFQYIGIYITFVDDETKTIQ